MSAANEQAGAAAKLHELARQVGELFSLGATADDAVGDLTLPAMKMGIDQAEAERLVRQFYAIEESRETPAESIARLARLSPLDYERSRAGEAKRLGMRASVLDREVEKVRPKTAAAAPGAADSIAPPPPVPWPEPIEAGAVLDELHDFLGRFIIVDQHALTAIALWIAWTHAFPIAETSPRLAILSPTKRCGKTRLLELLSLLCPSAIAASNLTPSAVFRVIDQSTCVLLLDEADTLNAHENGELRGLLNSGHTRGSAYVIRSIPTADGNYQPKRFSTWAAIATAAIGRLPDTWIDRSIGISMRRKLPAQPVERLTRANIRARADANRLAAKLARLAADNLDALRSANPEPPALDSDRAIDNWAELLRVADLAGPDWSARARAAAVALESVGREADDSLAAKLLSDIAAIFDAQPERESIGSAELVDALNSLELSPWSTISRGKPLTAARLARMLRQFDIFPRKTAARNEYVKADFDAAFTSYLTPPPFQSSKAPQTLAAVGRNDDLEVPSDGTLKSAQTPSPRKRSGALELSQGDMDVAHVDRAAPETEARELF
jgi:putative DNA primase/helicase